jgi:hypothetical protein
MKMRKHNEYEEHMGFETTLVLVSDGHSHIPFAFEESAAYQ